MAGFKEIWSQDIWRVCVELEDTQIIRYLRHDRRTTVWVRNVALEVALPSGDPQLVTVYGTTEAGAPVQDEYEEGIDDYPEEIAPLVPELARAAMSAQQEDRDTSRPG